MPKMSKMDKKRYGMNSPWGSKASPRKTVMFGTTTRSTKGAMTPRNLAVDSKYMMRRTGGAGIPAMTYGSRGGLNKRPSMDLHPAANEGMRSPGKTAVKL